MLVIGIGNEYRSDDGVGLAVAVHLQDMNLEDVTVITNSGDGADLLEILLEAEDVALVDAVNSSGKPGCVHRLDSRETENWDRYSGFSTHGFGVGQAVRMAKALGQLPPRLVLFGIEGANFEPGVGLSPEVAAAAEVVAGLIRKEVLCTNWV